MAVQQQAVEQPEEYFRFDECSYCCRKFESSESRMQCATCRNCIFCFDCYLVQPPYKTHTIYHKMHATSHFDFQLWPNGMTLQDDLALLQGILYYGFGSWDQIIKLIGKDYEPEMLVKHFYSTYGLNSAKTTLAFSENALQKYEKARQLCKTDLVDIQLANSLGLNDIPEEYIQFFNEYNKNYLKQQIQVQYYILELKSSHHLPYLHKIQQLLVREQVKNINQVLGRKGKNLFMNMLIEPKCQQCTCKLFHVMRHKQQ
ncbi:Conserved_hypothetical protein [Hexamita inflata]|uniref:Uncharacterized protein n=1 Tax=Hexamita inflata TaxID=28002 RepID=A0AA86TNF4_9EUKA|nr:Conserved hypothetical protein [Hexamita inflata]